LGNVTSFVEIPMRDLQKVEGISLFWIHRFVEIQVLELHQKYKTEVWQYLEWDEHFVGVEQ